MIDFDYLPRGLYAMARAHRVSAMSGHLGAAVVAGYFIGEQHPDLDEKVYTGIEAELLTSAHGMRRLRFGAWRFENRIL